MQGQCQICKGRFEIQPEWIGQRAECPHCKQNIVVQAAQSQIPPMNAQQNSNVQQNYARQPIANQIQTMSSSTNNEKKSTGALVCGIISLIMWRMPDIIWRILLDHFFDLKDLRMWHIPFFVFPLFIGFLLSVVGLILGRKNKYNIGITLNIIGLVVTSIDAIELVSRLISLLKIYNN